MLCKRARKERYMRRFGGEEGKGEIIFQGQFLLAFKRKTPQGKQIVNLSSCPEKEGGKKEKGHTN